MGRIRCNTSPTTRVQTTSRPETRSVPSRSTAHALRTGSSLPFASRRYTELARGAESALAHWFVFGLWMALCALLFAQATGGSHDTPWVVITLVPSDARDLACYSDYQAGATRCRFDARGAEQIRGRTLVPCMTIDRRILLTTDLFDLPAVRAQVARDSGRNERFTLECAARMVGLAEGVSVQWRDGAERSGQMNATVVQFESCSTQP